MEYKDTLNLPETDFPMKANLKVREPEQLQEWEDSDLTSFGDQFDPQFKSESFFVKPSWFYHGSLSDIIKRFKKQI